VKAYVTYVRPLLEYAVCVWSPYQLDDIAKIESVQRRFTKRLPGLSNASYSDRLSILGLRSLQLRRLHQDLIYTYKIIFGLVDLDCPKFFLVSPNETTRGHVSKLFVRQSRDGHGSKFLNPTEPNPLLTQPNPSAIIGTHNSVMKVRHKSNV